jgi:hypothetical protein
LQKHLWEVDHEYYCVKPSTIKSTPIFHSFAAFISERIDDMDRELLFRWDWVKTTSEKDTLLLNFLQQRRGVFVQVKVLVTDSDEPAVIEYLKPRLDHLRNLWAPLNTIVKEENE